jgi:sugar O-acyltransferase (sialic acid O-acetyltransferase NeuD family)
MIIVGAKGFSKDVLEVFHHTDALHGIAFYDDINIHSQRLVFDRFPLLSSEGDVKQHFKIYGNSFVLGVGKPSVRRMLASKIKSWGGVHHTLICPTSNIGHFNTSIGAGSNIMAGSIIANNVTISEGCLINMGAIISHDCYIGEYSEICPGVKMSGNCHIGNDVFVGIGAVILPGIRIGDGAIVGAGAVVTKDVPPYKTAVGVPARCK